MILRDYQERGVQDIRGAYREGFMAPLFVLPTGGGKTVLFCYIAEAAAARGKNVCIIVHRTELLSQTAEALGFDCGLIKSGKTPRAHSIQVASIGTLVNRTDQHDFDLLIYDEAHHCKAAQYERVREAYPKAKVLGVSATPVRLDNKGLGEFFDTLIEGPSVSELTERGFLSPAKVYAPAIPTMANVRIKRGDFDKKALIEMMGDPKIVGDAVKHYRRLADGLPAIVSCVGIEHSKVMAKAFCDAGYRFVHIDGKTPEVERTGALEDLATGAIHGVTNCDILGEGVDVPVVACAILLRPTMSLGLCMQQIGRALRPAPGKTHAIIIDHAGNVLRHGLPDMVRNWTLDLTKPKVPKDGEEEEVKVRQCPECYAAHFPAPVCPYCGFEYEPEGRDVPFQPGELVEVDKKQLAAIHRAEVRNAKGETELRRIAQERGYKMGWVWHQMQIRKGKQGRKLISQRG